MSTALSLRWAKLVHSVFFPEYTPPVEEDALEDGNAQQANANARLTMLRARLKIFAAAFEKAVLVSERQALADMDYLLFKQPRRRTEKMKLEKLYMRIEAAERGIAAANCRQNQLGSLSPLSQPLQNSGNILSSAPALSIKQPKSPRSQKSLRAAKSMRSANAPRSSSPSHVHALAIPDQEQSQILQDDMPQSPWCGGRLAAPAPRIKRAMKRLPYRYFLLSRAVGGTLRNFVFAIVAWALTATVLYFASGACVAPEIVDGLPTGANMRVPYISKTFSLYPRDDGGSAPNCGPFGKECLDAYEGLHKNFRCYPSLGDARLMASFYVGTTKLLYDPLVVGGSGDLYRGDSWVCLAAVDAGVISSEFGGCVSIKQIGPANAGFRRRSLKEGRSDFSISYDTWFPQSYTVSPCYNAMFCSTWALGVAFLIALFTAVPLMLLRPGRSALHVVMLMSGFWMLLYSTDRVFSFSTLIGTKKEIVSGLARLLPVLATGMLCYKAVGTTVVPPLRTHPTDVLLFGVLPYFVIGCVFNVWESHMPVTMGFSANLEVTPAFLTFAIIAGLIGLLTAGWLLYQQRRMHRLHWQLGATLCVVGAIVGISLVFGIGLHLHHYMFGLCLIGYLHNIQSRWTLTLYFVLLGMFTHGASRWGMMPAYDAPLPPNMNTFVSSIAGSVVLTAANYSFVQTPTTNSNANTKPPYYMLDISNAQYLGADFGFSAMTAAINEVQVFYPRNDTHSIIDLGSVLTSGLRIPLQLLIGNLSRPALAEELYISLAPFDTSSNETGVFSPGAKLKEIKNFALWKRGLENLPKIEAN